MLIGESGSFPLSGRLECGVRFNEVTLISVQMSFGRLGDLELREWLNEYIEVRNLKGNLNLITSLIDMYAK